MSVFGGMMSHYMSKVVTMGPCHQFETMSCLFNRRKLQQIEHMCQPVLLFVYLFIYFPFYFKTSAREKRLCNWTVKTSQM